jgi:hypothetical protein
MRIGLFGCCTSLSFVIGAATTALAQTPEPEPETRQTIVVNAADEKAKSLHPYEVTTAEKVITRIERRFTNQTLRWHPYLQVKRRDKIVQAYLPAVNPIVSPRLENNRLSFDNAAVAADVAKAPEVYRASWFEFDNATGESRPLSETTSATETIDAPRDLPTAAGSFILVEISADGVVQTRASR